MPLTSLTLLFAALLGLTVLLVQRLAMGVALAGPIKAPSRRPGISILKPLCGLDDGLEDNLTRFAELEYPRYEVLLGLKDEADPAAALAHQLAARWPHRFRVVLQRGSPGLNPKVNQLATLERAARYDLLLISDSNTRPPTGYLSELAALFEDGRVACVSSAVSGTGHESFGALLDNLHLASSIGPGQLASKLLADRDLVVGKSMALRRNVLDKLGGFAAYANVLAEDYVIGRDVVRTLGKRVAIAKRPVLNVATHRSVRSFAQRYLRWGVIHRTAVSLPTSLAQALLNPWPLALLAVALGPSRVTAVACVAVFCLKAALDLSAARRLGCGRLGLEAVAAVAVKDVVLFVAWANGLVSRTVEWRGTRLRVEQGSRLVAEPVQLPPAATAHGATP
jgi:ceramide glucosyltransferase